MYPLINLCITNNLSFNIEDLLISVLSEVCNFMSIITIQPLMCLGDFSNELHSTNKYLIPLGGFIINPLINIILH